MKNIQRKENNFQNRKSKFTELPITIVTDDEHKTGDNLEMTRQRLERAAMYLMSVFNLLKVSALHFEGQSETREMSGFFEDAANHCDIGYGIADSILASASCLTEFQPDEKSEPEKSKVNEEIENEERYTGDGNIDQIALAISDLLNNREVPKPLSHGFSVAMNDFINSQLGADEFNDDMSSPEYIVRHLKVYKNENQS